MGKQCFGVLLLSCTCVALSAAGKVCYEYVGCFDNSYPFNDLRNDFLPLSPADIGTVFILYTKGSNSESLSYVNSTLLQQSSFNPLRPTKFIIHGFTNSANEPWMHEMKDALLEEGDYNVILVGWKNGAKGPDYPKAVANTRVVGKEVALLIERMKDIGAQPRDVHLIGHSLGAHIAGFAGSNLKGIIGRISGMDPAGPAFKATDIGARLDPSDAVFVDAIHTNAAPITKGGAGIADTVGHVDFFPNGGRKQPGCEELLSGAVSALVTGDVSGAAEVVSCSHDRSRELYIESIRSGPCRFLSVGCTDYDTFLGGECSSCDSTGCAEMGYRSNQFPKATGKMFLLTNGRSGYCGYSGFVQILAAQTGVVGQLTLEVQSANGTAAIQVLSETQDLPDDGMKVPVLLPVPLDSITAASVQYTRYKGHLFGIGAGRQSWSLDSLIIQDPNGSRKQFCYGGLVQSGTKVSLRHC